MYSGIFILSNYLTVEPFVFLHAGLMGQYLVASMAFFDWRLFPWYLSHGFALTSDRRADGTKCFICGSGVALSEHIWHISFHCWIGYAIPIHIFSIWISLHWEMLQFILRFWLLSMDGLYEMPPWGKCSPLIDGFLQLLTDPINSATGKE